jgi:CheY-like chemotaxis protein
MCRVLVVDDSSLMRDGLAALLQREGYAADVSASGREAWMSLYSELPDLIVLDLTMPQMDGLLFLRLLRTNHHWSALPVFALAGPAVDPMVVDEAKSLGVKALASRTSAIPDLQDEIRRLAPLDKPSLNSAAVA